MAKRTARQVALPGTEDSPIKEIESRADDFADARDAIADARKAEGLAEQALRMAMHKHGKSLYRRKLADGSELEIKLREGTEKVLMRRRKARKPKGE